MWGLPNFIRIKDVNSYSWSTGKKAKTGDSFRYLYVITTSGVSGPNTIYGGSGDKPFDSHIGEKGPVQHPYESGHREYHNVALTINIIDYF